ncbi:glycerophosphodiester phosphodiesterase family protein [Fulvimarina sp. MAC3]|uniref:glycerophosphodiester phosphodiesterase family protein n=1 Tax=Fulvimarina sp. MAC3 TaxID=3148887 RepID=UPI0031FC591F
MSSTETGAPGWLTARPFAHRALHDGNRAIPENSCAAANRAIAEGYGIECDLQLSRDGIPLVFHDDDLTRLTGHDSLVSSMDAADLAQFNLCETAERIPTFDGFLGLVAGRVPLLIELKSNAATDSELFVAAVAKCLAAYDGSAALMSFDPLLVETCRRMIGDRPVGLTAEGNDVKAIHEHEEVAKNGVDFVSYDHQHLPNGFTDGLRKRGIPVLCWTIRSDDEARSALAHCDQITFETYLPASENPG